MKFIEELKLLISVVYIYYDTRLLTKDFNGSINGVTGGRVTFPIIITTCIIFSILLEKLGVVIEILIPSLFVVSFLTDRCVSKFALNQDTLSAAKVWIMGIEERKRKENLFTISLIYTLGTLFPGFMLKALDAFVFT
ncbi:hypothetical protein C0W92_15390 [Photobacterium angustum]|uniref:hypothetical protein n=1 Tax=Photobacterium angustum TaxID=661 RepID=UPI0005E064CA|nr:hypothetical protein [Photobacterium angustum]KJG29744.1 hypothetical protein UA69_12565 [Photobacterium angustum]PSW88719.1 hypothetical protein C0W92_15390 [Photobacterium angustum]PSW97732.1 hypothetical protein C0W79_05690 [Photobacterium angustum]PSX36908.1 hypothetical protein C0W38_10075 [Photobacterium angustum]